MRYHFVLNLFYQEVNPPVCLSYFPISYKFTIYTSVYQQIIHKYNLDNTRIAHFISFVKKDILCRCKDNGILIRFKTIRGLFFGAFTFSKALHLFALTKWQIKKPQPLQLGRTFVMRFGFYSKTTGQRYTKFYFSQLN